MDLAAEMYGARPISARRFCTLLLNLPHASRTMRAAAGTDWTADRTLLGLIVERLDTLTSVYVKSHGGRVSKSPVIVPRPKPQRQPAMSTDAMLAGLDRQMAGDA